MKYFGEGPKSLIEEEQVAYKRFRAKSPGESRAIEDVISGLDDGAANRRTVEKLRARAQGPFRLTDLEKSLWSGLLAWGTNPAGPHPSVAEVDGERWTKLIAWERWPSRRKPRV